MTTLHQLNIESFKEGNRLEAKLAKGGVPASLWETYASFANTDGGLILLGVKENKDHTFAIEGIDNPEQMEKAFWDGINNKKVVNINLLNNSDVEIKEVDGKTIIAIHVPRAERIYRPVYTKVISAVSVPIRVGLGRSFPKILINFALQL